MSLWSTVKDWFSGRPEPESRPEPVAEPIISQSGKSTRPQLPGTPRHGSLRVILKDGGVMDVDVVDNRGKAVRHYKTAIWMITGGTKHKRETAMEARQRLNSMWHYTVSGRVTAGPGSMVGEYINDAQLADADDVEYWASVYNFASDMNKPGS